MYIHTGHTQQILDRIAQLPSDADSDPSHADAWPEWVHLMRTVGVDLLGCLCCRYADRPLTIGCILQ